MRKKNNNMCTKDPLNFLELVEGRKGRSPVWPAQERGCAKPTCRTKGRDIAEPQLPGQAKGGDMCPGFQLSHCPVSRGRFLEPSHRPKESVWATDSFQEELDVQGTGPLYPF